MWQSHLTAAFKRQKSARGRRKQVEQMWKVKAKVVPVVIGALGDVCSNGSLSRRMQSQDQLRWCAEPSILQASGRGNELEKDAYHCFWGEGEILYM